MSKEKFKQFIHNFFFNFYLSKQLSWLVMIFLTVCTLALTLIYFKSDEISYLADQTLQTETKTAEQAAQNQTGQNNPTSFKNNSSSKKSSSSGGSQSSSESSGTNGSSSPEITTAPPTDESPSAVVAFYSDPQSDSDLEDQYHSEEVASILNSGANPVFAAGDLMEDGTQNSLDRFNNVTATLQSSRTFYSALGNNDREVGDPSTPSHLYLDNFSFPGNEQWYSLNLGNLHIVVLDSAFSSSNPSQLSWLASDLQSADSQSRITGVVFHHPTFAGLIASSLINYGADFVIYGHTHSYSQTTSDGIHYFNPGGQTAMGYFIVKIYSSVATVSYYGRNGGLVNSTSFQER